MKVANLFLHHIPEFNCTSYWVLKWFVRISSAVRERETEVSFRYCNFCWKFNHQQYKTQMKRQISRSSPLTSFNVKTCLLFTLTMFFLTFICFLICFFLLCVLCFIVFWVFLGYFSTDVDFQTRIWRRRETVCRKKMSLSLLWENCCLLSAPSVL